jgi:hypothetical protein
LRGLGTWLVKPVNLSQNSWRPWAVSIPWARVVGGILDYAGIPGFLQNLDRLYEESDRSQLQWEAFLLAIRGAFDAQSFTIKELIEAMVANSELKITAPIRS